MNNVIIILGIVLLLAAIVIMNAAAVKYIQRMTIVKDNAETTRGIISKFDNINSFTVEYTVNGIRYSGVCCAAHIKDGVFGAMIGKETPRYSVGDEVDVRYNIFDPSKFLIEGGKEYYKAGAVKIFILDAAILGLTALGLFIYFYFGH